MDVCRHGICRSVSRVEFKSLVEQMQSLRVALVLVQEGQCLEVVLVGSQAFGAFALGTGDFSGKYFRLDRAYNGFGDLVLEIEYIIEPAVETIGPNMVARPGVNQLGYDAHTVLRLSHASFQHISNVKLARDVANILVPPLELK